MEKKGNPSQSPATTTTTTNVYVRRKVEIDASKDTVTKQQPKASSSSTVPPPPEWEERYHYLQMLLNKLNDSDQTDHHLHSESPTTFNNFKALLKKKTLILNCICVKVLWSLSSAELSKHAVDLEKRSIQLSLEEGTV